MKIGLVGTELFHADEQPRQMWRFSDVSGTPSPSSGRCWWFGSTKTDGRVSNSASRLI